jgi:histidine ammonia-lyase
MTFFALGTQQLTVQAAMDIATGKLPVQLTPESRKAIEDCAAKVRQIVGSQKVVYGINTGFGSLCETIISPEDTAKLQHNLLISHAVGVGQPIAAILSKLMLICKVQALSYGFSGVSLPVVERIIWHIENDIIPVVPEKGSVGASGDLAPLAHLFLPLVGFGKVWQGGRQVETATVLQQHNLQPLTLGAKEGLGLINGTQFILAHAVLGLHQMETMLDWADVIGAMSLEACQGSAAPFRAELHTLRPYTGTQLVAFRLSKILSGSQNLESHQDCNRVQDPYSLRCMPQVHGASRHAWQHLHHLVTVELNSVTDNPIILTNGETISGGNFHGQPLAMAIDYAAIAASELGNISDRRCYLMLDGKYGLPKLLLKDSGLNSGFMIPQYTTAALCTENKTLCFPASADSIPTSMGQEDHVSMGSISGVKFLKILSNLQYILAIELLYAAQGVDLRKPLSTSKYLQQVLQDVRLLVPFATEDRLFQHDIEALHQYLKSTLSPIVL